MDVTNDITPSSVCQCRASKCCSLCTIRYYVPTVQVSMLSKGFGDVGDPKGGSTGTTGSQFLEQYKTAQALAQLAAQHSQTGPPNTNPTSWDTSATSLGQYGKNVYQTLYSIRSRSAHSVWNLSGFVTFIEKYVKMPGCTPRCSGLSMLHINQLQEEYICSGRRINWKYPIDHLFGFNLHCADMKAQPESAVHTPFTKRQPYQAATSTSSMLDVFLQDKGLPASSSSLPQQTSSPHVVPPPASSLPKMVAVPSLGQQVSPSSSDAQGSSPLPLQQHKLKQQKKRTSITTKVRSIMCGPWVCLYMCCSELPLKFYFICLFKNKQKQNSLTLLSLFRFRQWQWRCLAQQTSLA